jgi:fatty acid desaturase
MQYESMPSLFSISVIFETVVIFLLLGTVTLALSQTSGTVPDSLASPAITLSACFAIALLGLWLNRFYIVGHEVIHRKLFPNNPIANELMGTLILLPLMAPFTIYRKIHYFHHAHNRKSRGMATWDTFVTDKPLAPWRGICFRLVWLFCVFGGSFFLHTLVSILLFLLLPTRVGEQISPAFIGWKASARLKAWSELGL